ncbi:MAG: hypothetical protein ACM3SV_09090 [Betaproteobacteria bacterium]
MHKQAKFWILAAAIAALTGTAHSADPKGAATPAATPAPAAKPAASSDAYDKTIETARASAEEQAKLAKANKEIADKRAAEEAAEKKRAADVVAAEKAERDKEEAKRRQEQDRILKAEEKKRLQAERERSCVVKPVMTDAEIANCKKVWR